MLCVKCQISIRGAVDFLSRERKRRPFVLHSDHDSFYDAITFGCFLCRQIWDSLLLWRMRLLLGVGATDEHTLERFVPESHLRFTREITNIKRLASHHGFDSSELFTSGITYSAGILSSYVYIELWGPSSKSPEQPRWYQSFDLWPAHQRGGGGSRHLYPTPDIQALGTCTSSLPQLWNHWLQNCLENHITCRYLEKKNHAFLPKRLIEIVAEVGRQGRPESWRLVLLDAATVHVDYVTLSHCWGTQQPLKLTKSNLDVFSRQCPIEMLPKTYEQAIEIAVSLGYRYIWIDSLCIIQGNKADWLDQSPQMASIYGHARCNIAATWASNGTQGCFSQRDPFTIVGTTFWSTSPESAKYDVTLGHFYDKEILYSPLNQRGWVVQERCLALRQLSFTKRQVYWECAELFASEQFPNGIPEGACRDGSIEIVRPPRGLKPRLNFCFEDENRESWCSLVETYSQCTLSHQSDKMIALASLAESLRARTGDVYLAGLWKRDLHLQLFWSHWVMMNEDTLRLKPPIYHAPSWSWACMNCAISMDRDYFSATTHDTSNKRVSMVDILDATVASSDSGGLHSFTHGKLWMRAIAVAASFVHTGEDWKGPQYTVTVLHNTECSTALNIEVSWDEHIPLGQRSLQSQNWRRLQRQRSSQLQLVLVKFSFDRSESCAEGLVLSDSETQEDRERTFVRIGSFSCVTLGNTDWFHHTILDRLGMPPGTQIRGRLDLGNVQIADLVQIVTIV